MLQAEDRCCCSAMCGVGRPASQALPFRSLASRRIGQSLTVQNAVLEIKKVDTERFQRLGEGGGIGGGGDEKGGDARET